MLSPEAFKQLLLELSVAYRHVAARCHVTAHPPDLLANIAAPSIAVAVSGGPDSMALTLLLDEYLRSVDSRANLIALTVDHHIPCAPDSPSVVAAWMSARGIRCEVLDVPEWISAPPQTQIEECARRARYR
ncbi:MAG: hypothetical protein LBR89_01580, partial [Holosporales bacterium]|nr:hypothetical protein [Holosporales bacterium]